jgi:hypothetical protein
MFCKKKCTCVLGCTFWFRCTSIKILIAALRCYTIDDLSDAIFQSATWRAKCSRQVNYSVQTAALYNICLLICCLPAERRERLMHLCKHSAVVQFSSIRSAKLRNVLLCSKYTHQLVGVDVVVDVENVCPPRGNTSIYLDADLFLPKRARTNFGKNGRVECEHHHVYGS